MGLSDSIIISACFPGSIVPTSSSTPKAIAPLLVAILITSNGGMPASIRISSSWYKLGIITKNILKITNHYVIWSVHAAEQKCCQIESWKRQ
jgi:hypothetical protein